jgi:hypothetical protein
VKFKADLEVVAVRKLIPPPGINSRHPVRRIDAALTVISAFVEIMNKSNKLPVKNDGET